MRCQHPDCSCESRDGDRFCSESCRGAAARTNREGGCDCGHAECDASS
jgi:hypothetical protein